MLDGMKSDWRMKSERKSILIAPLRHKGSDLSNFFANVP